MRAIVVPVAQRHPELLATILFGSLARHDERPLDDVFPSDVDGPLIFDMGAGQHRIPADTALAISESIGLALDRFREDWPPREVRTMLAVRDLVDWDPLFIENVARDGLPLWARGPLPAPLAAVAGRRLPVAS